MKDDNFITRALRDRRVDSQVYSDIMYDMANRLREYRRTEMACFDDYYRRSKEYHLITVEIERLEKRAAKAYENFLLWNQTIEVFYQTRPNYVEHGDQC